MAERDEVGMLGEAVDHRENDRLAAHLGKALDEVHGYIRPNLRRHLQGLKEPRRSQGLCLVALASLTRPNPVADQGTIARDVEVGAKTMEGFLHTLMARRVSQQQDPVTEIVVRGNEDQTPMKEKPIGEASRLLQLTRSQLLLDTSP